MSTKNISRSIIEGGRSNRNKFDRYHSNATVRAETRALCHVATYDPEAVDGRALPKRDKVFKDFDDKLAPVYRWMRKHVGQPWDSVYAQLRQTFDTRTTAGRHIIFDHVLRSVDHRHDESMRGYHDFYVDAEGLLRLSERNRWQRRRRSRDLLSEKELRTWLAGRKILDTGVALLWMVPAGFEWRECGQRLWHGNGFWYGSCRREHRPGTRRAVTPTATVLGYEKKLLYQEPDGLGGVRYYRDVPVSLCRQAVGPFRQGARLSQEDLVKWRQLSSGQQSDVSW